MSVARPSETGCRLVRIKRVPSSDFQQPIPVVRVKNQQHRYLPPVTLRTHPTASSSSSLTANRNWINQRHSDVWCNLSNNRLAAVESSPRYYQVDVAFEPGRRPIFGSGRGQIFLSFSLWRSSSFI